MAFFIRDVCYDKKPPDWRLCCLSMASQEGFEPPTPRLEGACSIQLSYWEKRGFATLRGPSAAGSILPDGTRKFKVTQSLSQKLPNKLSAAHIEMLPKGCVLMRNDAQPGGTITIQTGEIANRKAGSPCRERFIGAPSGKLPSVHLRTFPTLIRPDQIQWLQACRDSRDPLALRGLKAAISRSATPVNVKPEPEALPDCPITGYIMT